MSSSRDKSANIKLFCRRCFSYFNATLRGQTISCQRIRQHIQKTPECFQVYFDENLVSGNGKVNLHTSIDNDVSTPGSSRKRKASMDPPNTPLPKKVLVRELATAFLQENFGAHPVSNMLLKDETFSNKEKLIRTQNWKAPSNKIMNELFCNANISFNHFSKNAIILNPKVEHLAEKPCHPPTEVEVATNDDYSIISSVVGEPFGSHDNATAASDEEEELDDDHFSVASDENVDDGSVRNVNNVNNDSDSEDEDQHQSNGSTQRMEILAENGNNNTNPATGEDGAVETNTAFGDPQIGADQGTPAIPTNPTIADGPDFTLLNRWDKQLDDNTIQPGFPTDPVVVSELGLLHIQHTFGLSLEAVKAVKKWAHTSYNAYEKIFNVRPRTRKKQMKMIREAMGITVDDSFEEIAFDWLPEKKKRPIHTRSFTTCLYDLLSNEELVGDRGQNISLPHPEDPYIQQPDVLPQFASELHHGWWWTETAKDLCSGEKEILVPIIGYMDGVSTDNNGRLPVTPFNITLGIFDTETRRKAEAWTTILLYPDDNVEASIQKGTKTIHKMQNLHNSISVAFRELKELMESKRSIAWRLRYGPEGKEWEVYLKFAFAYVIGDTEMHDKLCGRYGPRTKGVKSVCRHCTAKTDELVKGGEIFEGNHLYTPEMLDSDKYGPDYFKSISHHPIRNAFHELDFGANRFNIHLATPGELLHMVQKGACTRSIEGFVEMWKNPSVVQDDVTAVENHHKSTILLDQLDHLGKVYGGYLFRQSDRNKPRTKFRSSLFKNCKVRTHLFF